MNQNAIVTNMNIFRQKMKKFVLRATDRWTDRLTKGHKRGLTKLYTMSSSTSTITTHYISLLLIKPYISIAVLCY